MKKTLLLALICFCTGAFGAPTKDLKTNAVHIANAPDWLTMTRINTVVDHIQSIMEWDIRRFEATWYYDEASFEKAHGLGPTVMAVSRRSDNAMSIGPRVTSENFDGVFGHELVHIISFQKYKDAIPKWLEEGMANYLGHWGKVDYKWLAQHTMPTSVAELTHPFGGTEDHVRFSYMASQALMEMIASHCDVQNLLRMSVKRKLEDKLENICGIKDLNVEFKKWVSDKAAKG